MALRSPKTAMFLQRRRVHVLIGNLRHDQVEAFRAIRGDGHREPHVGGGFGVRAVLDQHLDDGGIAGRKRFEQRRRFGVGLGVRIGIGLVIEQEFHDRCGANSPCGNHQRRSQIVGLRVDVGAMVHQEPGLFEVPAPPTSAPLRSRHCACWGRRRVSEARPALPRPSTGRRT